MTQLLYKRMFHSYGAAARAYQPLGPIKFFLKNCRIFSTRLPHCHGPLFERVSRAHGVICVVSKAHVSDLRRLGVL